VWYFRERQAAKNKTEQRVNVIWYDDGISLIECACGEEVMVSSHGKTCQCGRRYKLVQYVAFVGEGFDPDADDSSD
jgi:hypothetical protein